MTQHVEQDSDENQGLAESAVQWLKDSAEPRFRRPPV